jgi:hypothetical protein
MTVVIIQDVPSNSPAPSMNGMRVSGGLTGSSGSDQRLTATA